MLKEWKVSAYLRTLWMLLFVIALVFSYTAWSASASAAVGIEYNPFKIRVVDAETGRGIPLVEVSTVNEVVYVTDSAGYVAFFEPGLMGEDVWFELESHGYTHHYESFGAKGTTVKVTPGGSVTFEMERINVAERLYRVTGQGIYKDSVILGEPVPIHDPLLGAGKVMGQDTVQTIEYNGKLYWFWGDTDKPNHALGNFRTTGATSELPGEGGLDPDAGVNLTYFTDDEGTTKKLVPQHEGDGNLFWVSGPMTTKDANGQEKLLIKYSNLHGLDNEVASGILIWNDENEEFSDRIPFDMNQRWKHPDGQSTLYVDNGVEYWLFNQPWPVKRVKNTYEDMTNMNSYESFTPLAPGTQYNGASTELNRDGDGNLVWEWRKDTPAITQQQEAELIGFGKMTADEARFQLKGVDTGETVLNHTGSVKWNEYRQVWTNIIEQREGSTSLLGEIWYAEAPSPTGPWKLAKKIITHDGTDFYNVARHSYFDKDNGRVIYFEGTYVAMFGNVGNPTPYYDYNQIMYKLDLSDPRLASVQLDPNEEPGGEEPAAILTGPAAVNAGQSFDAVYKVDGVEHNVFAQDVTFTYDPAKLEYVSATPSDDDVAIVEEDEAAPGQLRFIIVNLDGNANRDTLKLQFKALATGETVTTSVALTGATLADENGNEFELQGATYNVRIDNPQGSGDLNHDERISVGDLAVAASAYGKNASSPDWEQVKKADLNNDGKVDILDLAELARQIFQ